MQKISLLIIFVLSMQFLYAQNDTLPKFFIKSKDGKISLSFINPYSNAQQINIQRSPDSLKNFITIYSLPDPSIKKFTYKDEKPPAALQYYRVFVLLNGANYFFTTAQKPFLDTTKPPVIVKPEKPLPKPIVKDTIKQPEVKIDSVAVEKPVVKKYVWEPSVFIFTANDGNIAIHLPDIKMHKYAIKFYEEDETFLFSIDEVQDSPLILDKANFFHSGWFKFELFEDGKLKEKNKFLITRDN